MAENNAVDRSKMTVGDEVVVSMDSVNKWYGPVSYTHLRAHET